MYFIPVTTIYVRKYEVWILLSYIYVNNDEIGMPNTKKIKTFQSKKHSISQNHSIPNFQYINFLNTILSFANGTKTMYK